MPALLNSVDPEGLEEFSVVFTDRSLNHMSAVFQKFMRDISSLLKEVYNADAVAVVPGGGTYGMEAVARQFARGEDVLVVRNGWYVWRVKHPQPSFKNKLKWYQITVLLTGIRFLNIFTTSERKEAFTEAIGRTVGILSLPFNKPK